MKKIYLFIFACMGLLTFITSSVAGNRPGALTITGGAGYDYFSAKRQIENHGVGLLSVGYDFTENWGVEAMAGGFNTKFDPDTGLDESVSVTMVNFDGAYHFVTTSLFEPYLLAGVGLLNISPGIPNANNEGSLNGALGIQFFLMKSVALRVEARDIYTMVSGRNDVLLNGGVSVLFDLC